MSKPGTVDLELKKAFKELQEKMVETSMKIQVIDSQIDVLEKVQRILEATQREIAALPPDTRTYEAIGRTFLLTDIQNIKNNLRLRASENLSRASDWDKNKKCLEKNLKESENNIREMVQQRKEQGE